MIVALTRYYAVSEKSEALSSEIMVSWIPALAFVLYCASMVAGIYSSRSLKGPFIGVAALARSALLCGWLLWEGIGGNSIAPLVEVSAGRMREIGGSSITSAALTRGALMTEWLTTAVLVVALLQDAHVLFDSVAGVTSSIMNVPIGYEQCELCGEVLLIEESGALDEEDVSPVTPLTERACLLSTMSCGIRHQCAVLRR
ncbi:transmembrane protein, putative, partial [Bodo saltans]